MRMMLRQRTELLLEANLFFLLPQEVEHYHVDTANEAMCSLCGVICTLLSF